MNLQEELHSNTNDSLPQLLNNIEVRASANVGPKNGRGTGIMSMAGIHRNN